MGVAKNKSLGLKKSWWVRGYCLCPSAWTLDSRLCVDDLRELEDTWARAHQRQQAVRSGRGDTYSIKYFDNPRGETQEIHTW